jgi:very-short-patch-repair endonuclease
MNFGPLNQQGGERRLNVAVTRARRELLVFSSLRAEQIELQRTQSLGVRHLRAFLDYAARGVQAITEAVAREPGSACESPFEREVKAALESLGHEVHAQIGCSGYRIDLAVVDPRQKGRYVLGVECDGASYHSAATARDRDRLRQGVLERLGWRLCRIWSTDWWQDPSGELQRVHETIEAALRTPVLVAEPVLPPEQAAPFAAAPAPVAAPSSAPESDSDATAAVAPLPRYQVAALAVSKDVDGLWSPRKSAQVQLQIESVLRAEAPIDTELLVRRIATAWSNGRITARVRDRIQELAGGLGQVHDTVVWRADQAPADYREFRTSPPGAADRDAEHLPTIEVANAIAWLLAQHGSLRDDDCVREAARLFGFTRVGTAVRAAMTTGLELAIQDRGAIRDGAMIRLS